MNALRYYYWGHPIIRNCFNFGDLVTPWLLEYYCPHEDVIPATSAADADVFSTGSIIHHIPANKFAIILGSGLIQDETRNMPAARFYAVRGKLTKERLGITGDIVLGDPALLLPRLLPMPADSGARKPVGIIPHFSQYSSPLLDPFRNSADYKIINVRAETRYVVQDICSCSAIISSSLHGMIVADAYGIPNIRMVLEPELIGGDFKFNDYYSSIGREGASTRCITPGDISTELEFDTSYMSNISAVQNKLDSAFKQFIKDIPSLTEIKSKICAKQREEEKQKAEAETRQKAEEKAAAQLRHAQIALIPQLKRESELAAQSIRALRADVHLLAALPCLSKLYRRYKFRYLFSIGKKRAKYKAKYKQTKKLICKALKLQLKACREFGG